MSSDALIVRGAREHNLKNITVEIPRNTLTVITGLSGSGKSSLAFDTIYAEGQRRYVESLSAYARQFLGLMEKPDVDAIEGLSPAISIEQKTAGANPRSTVGTITEIYDYLRLLWARTGTPHCPNDGSPIERQTASQITEHVLGWPDGTKIEVLAPLVRGRKGEFRDVFEDAQETGLRPGARGRRRSTTSGPSRSSTGDRITTSPSWWTGSPCARPTAAGCPTRSRRRSRRPTGWSRSCATAMGRPSPWCSRSATPARSAVSRLPELEPRQFSFNSPFGACPDCSGLGTRREVNAELVLGDPSLSILEGVILPWGEPSGYLRKVVLPTLARTFKFDLNTPWKSLPAAARKTILFGAPGKTLTYQYHSERWHGSYESSWTAC